MAPLVLLTGCQTVQQRQQVARRQLEIRQVEEHSRRMQGRVEAAEMAQEQLAAEVEVLRAEMRVANSTVQQLARRMNELEAKQIQEMQEVVARVEGLLKKKLATPSSVPNRRTGRKHVVESGHTLSAIAAAYGTTVTVIKQANDLRSDDIYVGQALFIPK